jgi:thiamine-monophosphate kinase
MTGEQSLIDRIRRAIPSRFSFSSGLRLGIGDDAAVIRQSPDQERIVTCDAFLENVHFLRGLHPPESVGYKSLARATSDLAAMGATPRYFLLTLALPRDAAGKWLDRYLAGVARAATEFDLLLIGGDTSRFGSIAISITVLGAIAPGLAVTRSGARPGDLIFVSGVLGSAQLGLELVRRKLHWQKKWKAIVRTHLYPPIRVSLGRILATKRLASAMIDLSDGLSTDLHRLCDSSGVGARLWPGRIPAVAVPTALDKYGFDSLQFALHGGDDYELIFTVPRRLTGQIPTQHLGVPVTHIGEIIHGRKLLLIDAAGRSSPLLSLGWDPFRTSA